VIYKVLFRVRLHEKVDPSDNAHSLLTGTWPEKWGQPAPPSPPDDWGRESNNFVLVDYYSPPAERPIGPLTLVEGQWTKHPPELQDPLPNGGRRNKRLSFVALSRHPEVAGTPIQGTIEIDDAMGFRPSIRPVTMRYAPDDWRKNIYFLEVSEVLTNQTGGPHYVIQFVLEPNVPPRPIRAKAKEVGDQRVGFLLYYPSDRYTDKDEDGSRYQYFNLDKFVVDPDGVGRPEDMLRPLYVRLSQDVEGWRVIGGKSDPNGWRLRIPANYTIRPRAVVQLSLSDEVSRVGVDAVIIRQ
jgi:hypothetical protein